MLCGLMYDPVKSEKKIEKFLDENVVKKEKKHRKWSGHIHQGQGHITKKI